MTSIKQGGLISDCLPKLVRPHICLSAPISLNHFTLIIAFTPSSFASHRAIVAISAPGAGRRFSNYHLSFLYGLISASFSKLVQARNRHLYSAYFPTAQTSQRHPVPMPRAESIIE
jgi:hypothetical protein